MFWVCGLWPWCYGCHLIIIIVSSGELKEKDVLNMLCGIAFKWRQLGTQFGLEQHELEAIKMNNYYPMDWLLQVIAMKKARTTHFGWIDIVEALRAIQENSLADRICRKYDIVLSKFDSGS